MKHEARRAQHIRAALDADTKGYAHQDLAGHHVRMAYFYNDLIAGNLPSTERE